MSLPTTLDLSTNNSSTYNIIFLKSGIKYLYKCNPTPDKNNLGGIIDLNLLYQWDKPQNYVIIDWVVNTVMLNIW
jgi:hypothetical protein